MRALRTAGQWLAQARAVVTTVARRLTRRRGVRFTHGDIFESSAQTITNTVNCVGVMGKGLALQFKRRYPEMYEDYVDRSNRGEVRPGEPYVYRAQDRWILNFPTKRHWREKARIGDIEEGLVFLQMHAASWGITSLALPPLGCGEGGLKWEEVKPMMESYLSQLDASVEIYEPARSSAKSAA